jgi:hypothetical protein
MTQLRGDLLVAGLLPVVCVAALLAVEPDPGDRVDVVDRAPVRSALSAASVVCPSPVGRQAGEVAAATLTRASGDVLAGLGEDVRPVRLTPSRTSPIPAGEGPVVVAGADDLAPSLVAGRSLADPLMATDCRPPMAEQWFTGLGSGATHRSVIELVNPNAGRAVADVRLWSQAGPLQVPDLLGVSVPGGTSTELDLADLVPRRGELMASVTTSRGRLAVDVRDSVDELGTGLVASDWLAPQAAPATANLLLGVARGDGDRLLVLGNPGDDEVRAEIRIVTPRSVFAPADLEPVVVPPGTTKPVTLSALLKEAADQGAIGVLVEATGPVTANLRQTAGDDLSEVAAAAPVAAPTAAVVPPGRARLLLAGAEGVGVATMVALDARGKELATEKVELTAGMGATLALPDGTALVTLTPERTSVRAALLVTAGRAGTAVVQVRELQVDGLVPAVRPVLPDDVTR